MSELEVFARIDAEVVRGQGVQVWTADGRELLDLYGAHAVAVLGHGHPALLEALRAQAEAVMFQTNLVPMDVRRRAAAALAGFAPEGLDHVFFVSTGAEANENALRLAFLARPGRTRVACLAGGFHGRTAAASALTAGSDRWYAYPRAPFEVLRLTHDDPAAADAIDETVAAVVVEPVQGVAGARAIDHAVLRALREACDRHDALLVADEVQAGMGRSGHPFSIQASGVRPDMLTVAKGLGGGFPVAALVTSPALAAVPKKGDLGTTFGGGPLACAMVEATVTAMTAPGFLENVRARGQQVRDECAVGPVQEVTGAGLLCGFRCDRPASEVVAALREAGILAGGSADPEVFRIMPPLVLEPAHVTRLAEALAAIGPAA